MRNLFLTAALTLLSSLLASSVFAQQQKESHFSAAFRYGPSSTGAAVSVFLKKSASISLMYTAESASRRNMFNVMYTERFRFSGVKGLKWFGGAGMHLGWRDITSEDDLDLRANSNGSDVPVERRLFVLGTAAIIGLEYSFDNSPLFITIDSKPYVDLVNGQSSIRDFALSAGLRF